jgi:hypothetical protein
MSGIYRQSVNTIVLIDPSGAIRARLTLPMAVAYSCLSSPTPTHSLYGLVDIKCFRSLIQWAEALVSNIQSLRLLFD